MTIQIKMLTLGIVHTNCYIVGDTDTGEALVIDPVDDAPLIVQTAQESGWTIKLILATHGHFDHVLASQPLKETAGAPFYINKNDMVLLEQQPEWGPKWAGHPFPEAAQPDRFLTDEPEVIELGAIKLETLFTPGHAPGHICFFMREQKVLFSGDCLFAGSIGAVNGLPFTNFNTLMQSITEKLMPLDDDVQVLSGHGGPTTIGRERLTNPYLR